MTINLRVWLGDLELTDYPFGLRFGMDLSRPENVYTVMESWLADGEIVSSDRSANRSLSVPLLIVGADQKELADNEALLIAECEKPMNTLTVDPGDGYGPATVFRTFRAQARHERTDDAEIALLRPFLLEIPALPGARSVAPTTIGAEFVADSVVIWDDCESTTGWSATGDLSTWNPVAVAVDSTVGYRVTGTGSIRLTPSGTVTAVSSSLSHRMRVTKTGLTIDASGGGYLTVRLRTEWQFVSQDNIVDAHVTTSAGGRQSVATFVSAADANGFVRLSWALPDTSTVTGFDLNIWQQSVGPSGTPSPRSWFDSIGLAGNSSSAQSVTRFEVEGSMRTEASFEVSAAVGLGDVLLYTCPDRADGFTPNLMKYRTAGSTTVDAAAINGAYTSPAGTGFETVLSVPQAALRPGSYAVLARMKVTGGPLVTVTAQTKIGSTLVGPTNTVTGSVSLPDAAYHVARIGVLELPPLVTDAAANAVTVLTVTSASGTVKLDELMVFPMEDAALTWVACGSGAPSATVASRLWIDEVSPTNPKGARLIGNDASRLDARYAFPQSRGRHVLKPGWMLAYLLTDAATGPDLRVTFTKAWHSNAGA